MTTATAHPAAKYHERRRAAIDERIFTHARGILETDGLAALTIERVAAETGIAKTTIYRRVDNATDLATLALGIEPETLAKCAADIADMTLGLAGDAAKAQVVLAAALARVTS